MDYTPEENQPEPYSISTPFEDAPADARLNPADYPLTFTVGGYTPPTYQTKREDITLVSDKTAAIIHAGLQGNTNFEHLYPDLYANGQTPLVNGHLVNVGSYYVILTETGWNNVLNHISGRYDENHVWHNQYDVIPDNPNFNCTFGCDYSLDAVIRMALVSDFRINPALVTAYITGNQTGDLSDIDLDHYAITVYPNNLALQDEVNELMKNYHPAVSDLEFVQDPANPTVFDVDLNADGIQRLKDTLGKNYLLGEIVADDADYKLNQAGQYTPEGQEQTVLQLNPVDPINFIKDIDKLPEDAKYTFTTPVSTKKPGDKQPVEITILYPDGSTDHIKTLLNVLPRDFKLDLIYEDPAGHHIEEKQMMGQTGQNLVISFDVPAGYHLKGAGMPTHYLVEDFDHVIRVIVISDRAELEEQQAKQARAEELQAQQAAVQSAQATSRTPETGVENMAGFGAAFGAAALSLLGILGLKRKNR